MSAGGMSLGGATFGGPAASSLAGASDHAACAAAIRVGSRSFHVASLLLPADMRSAAYALYAFCRLSDDLVDLERGAHAGVARLARRLDAAYAGRPYDDPVDRALADTVARHGVPRAALDALLDGLSWDADGRRYETFSDLLAYAARVAGSVGVMMAALMQARTPAMAARACDLGLAMQLTNIARDVGEDARAGRLYLPLDWMREAGLDPDAFVLRPRFTPALGSVVARLLDEADAIYARAEGGLARLPAGCRPAIWAARRIYAEIGVEVRRAGYDSVTRRARTGAGRKLALLGRAAIDALVARRALEAGAAPEVRFLVDALAATAPRAPSPARAAWRLDDGVVRVIDLLDALERRDRARRAHGLETRRGA